MCDHVQLHNFRFAYSLVDDEDRDDDNEIEQGNNKNFGAWVHFYGLVLESQHVHLSNSFWLSAWKLNA